MNILILSYEFPPCVGGVGYYTYGVAKSLRDIGRDVIVIAPHASDDTDFDKREHFKTIRVSRILVVRELMMLIAVLYLVNKYHIKRIFNSVWLPCGVISFLVTRFINIPYFVVTHGSDILDYQNIQNKPKHFVRRNLRWLKYLIFKHATGVFAVSNFTRNILINQGIPKDKINVVLNGVDTVRFRPDEKSPRILRKHNLLGQRVILTVARLDRYKGQDMVIQSLPKVLQKHPNTIYIIVGNGKEKDKLRNLVKKLKLEPHVRFVDYVSDEELLDYYNSCDVFIMVSRQVRGDFEGFGLVYLEANACGKPVIGGRTGGVPEAIVDGKVGFLVNPASTKEISQALINVLSDAQLAQKMGKAGRNRVEQELNWIAVTKKMLNIMNHL